MVSFMKLSFITQFKIEFLLPLLVVEKCLEKCLCNWLHGRRKFFKSCIQNGNGWWMGQSPTKKYKPLCRTPPLLPPPYWKWKFCNLPPSLQIPTRPNLKGMHTLYCLICTHRCAYQEVRNVVFWNILLTRFFL